MRNKKLHHTVVAVVVSWLAGLGSAWAGDEAYRAGLAAMEEYRYAEGLQHFRLAAEKGNRDAQRSVGLILLYGQHLYGQEIGRDSGQAVEWLRRAAEQGCEVSSRMLRQHERSKRG